MLFRSFDIFAPRPAETFYYVIRAVEPYIGSWGRDSAGNERIVRCSSCATEMQIQETIDIVRPNDAAQHDKVKDNTIYGPPLVNRSSGAGPYIFAGRTADEPDMTSPKYCLGGSNQGMTCTSDANCPGGTCVDPVGVRRALMRFDLVMAAVPTDSRIENATLHLQMKTSVNEPTTLKLHRLDPTWGSWGEAGSSGLGQGAPAQTGDATWNMRFYQHAPPDRKSVV